jgi:hypothetical protein
MTGAHHHHHHAQPAIHAGAGDLGALLVGIGAVMLLVDAVGPPVPQRFTFGGTLRTPSLRMFAGFELVGSIFVAVGSGILLFNATDLSAAVVIVAVAVATVFVYIAMALQLRAHHRLIEQESQGPHRSFLWCLAHPLWRPAED